MRIVAYCCVVFLCIFNSCYAEQVHVPLHQEETLNADRAGIDELWEFVKKITNSSNIPPPHIYFVSFNRTVAGKAWSDWQDTWKKNARMEDNPPWWMFDGFTYKGTNIIQLDPKLFLKKGDINFFLRSSRYEGNLDIAHEMLHYIFGIKGVPGFLEHCIMDAGGFHDAIATHIYGSLKYGMSLKGICENTPQILIKGGIEQALKAPLHNKYFK